MDSVCIGKIHVFCHHTKYQEREVERCPDQPGLGCPPGVPEEPHETALCDGEGGPTSDPAIIYQGYTPDEKHM